MDSRRAERGLVRAMDKRAGDALQVYEQQRTFAIGYVEGVTLSGAAVRLEGSGRYLSNVQSLRGNEIVAGSYVVLARIGRGRWVILGAMEQEGKSTVTTDTDTILAAPANFSGTDLTTGVARLEWDASVFDIRYWQLHIGTSSESTVPVSEFDSVLTDNSQYFYDAADNTYYARARAVGSNWKTSSWTGWISFQVTSTGGSITLDHGALTGLGDDDHSQYTLVDGTRPTEYTPGSASDWPAGDPGDTPDALDVLAERVKDLEDVPSIGDASGITYSVGIASDWDAGDPGNVDDALDELAERVQDLEDAPSTGDASDIAFTPGVPSDWTDPDPTQVAGALDALMAHVGALKATDLLTYMEPLTNGVASDPELVFSDGDVIMVEVAF